jgi:hypothetical protein
MGYLSFASIHRVKTQRRRFPPPWIIEETMACFVVKDHSGQKLSISRMSLDGERRQTN